MSVICQNFVQNAWKKDLCSNCFKSLGDHEHQESVVMPLSCAAETQRNGISSKNGTRYISQATTIYQSRGIHTTWTSLLAERQEKKGGFFQLENGFHGKLLTINTKNTEKKAVTKMNGVTNGLTNGHVSENGDGPAGILKATNSGKGQKANVGFCEEGPLVIGYGGNDYDSSDEHDWETGSDDGDFPIEALDCTDEDRAITKITKENTEFNSDNANLLKETESGKKKDVSNGPLPNGTKVREEAVSEKKGLSDSRDKNTPAIATSSSPEINKSQKAPNGIVQAAAAVATAPTSQQHPCIRRKDPAPPQASVKPFYRETSPAAIVAQESKEKETKIKASDDVISAIEDKIKSLRNGVGLPGKVANAPVEQSLQINDSKSGTNKDNQQETNENEAKPRENTAKGNPVRNNREITTNGYRDSPQSMAHARKSFLHGKPDDLGVDEESAIYTPGKGDLFVDGNRDSSSSNETSTEDSDSGTSVSSTTFVCSAELNLSNKIREETETSSARGNETTGLAEWHQPRESVQGEKKKAIKESAPSASKQEKTSIVSSSSALSAARDDTQSDRSTSPDVSRKTVKFAPNNEAEGVYGRVRRLSKDSTPSNSTRSSVDSDETPIYYAVSSTIIHTESTANIPHVATVRRTPVCHYAETNIFPESDRKYSASPEKDNAKNRESRLAALAQELEQARLGNGNGSKRPAPSPPKQTREQSDRCPPPTSQSTPSTPTMSSASAHNHVSTETETGNVTIYGKPAIYDTPNNGSSSKGKSATISAVHGKKVLALLNFDEGSKSSKKSNKFSIKKFLKRGKDMESLDNIFHGQQPVSPTSPNVKAWKNNDFDRSKMKLEIIHPMDMANKEGGTSSFQSTSEMISISKTYDTPSPISSSERSLSTPLSGSQDGIYDDEATWQGCQRSNGPTPIQAPNLTETEEMGNVSSPVMSTFAPTGNSTTPSGTNIYGSTPTIDTVQTQSVCTTKNSGGKPIRPPKPPPPPRLKSLPGKMDMENNVVVSNGTSSQLPPKPQVPKRLFRPSMLKSEYANLDVRSPMAPKKPDRLPNSRPSTPGSLELANPNYYDDDNAYELVGVETDSNYNTQSDITDEITCYSDAEPIYTDGYSMCTFDFMAQETKTDESCNPETLWRDSDRVTVTVQRGATYERQGDGPGKPPGSTCGDKIDTMAWLSLEQSYAIVAAANHEVLAKLIDQVLNQKTNLFQKPDGRNIGWDDFYLQQNNPIRVIGEKVIYDAVFRHAPKRDVTLLVTAQPSGLLRMESHSKKLFLGTFADFLPRSSIEVSWCSQTASDTVQAQVFILPKSEMGSIQSYFFEKSLPIEKGDTSQFEKELCYVYLQLINALKVLQAHGTEDVDMKQEDLILSKDEKDQMCNLIFLSGDFVTDQDEHGSFDKVSLCQYALIFLLRVLHVPDAETLNSSTHNFPLSACARKIFITVAKALAQEKASSLSKAKNLLEFHLWGPKDKVYGCLSGSQRMEETLQRWLDIERAQNLRLLIRSQKNVTAYEEHQLQFLVRTNSKALKDMTSTLSFEKL